MWISFIYFSSGFIAGLLANIFIHRKKGNGVPTSYETWRISHLKGKKIRVLRKKEQIHEEAQTIKDLLKQC